MSRLQLPKLQIQFQTNDRFGSEAVISKGMVVTFAGLYAAG